MASGNPASSSCSALTSRGGSGKASIRQGARIAAMNPWKVGRALRSAPEVNGSETVVCGALGEVALPDGSWKAAIRQGARPHHESADENRGLLPPALPFLDERLEVLPGLGHVNRQVIDGREHEAGRPEDFDGVVNAGCSIAATISGSTPQSQQAISSPSARSALTNSKRSSRHHFRRAVKLMKQQGRSDHEAVPSSYCAPNSRDRSQGQKSGADRLSLACSLRCLLRLRGWPEILADWTIQPGRCRCSQMRAKSRPPRLFPSALPYTWRSGCELLWCGAPRFTRPETGAR